MPPSRFTHLLRDTAAMFRPPFDGLSAVIMLYIIFCFLVYPHSSVLSADLPDTDDYMYLNQLLDWMNGQSWYDNVQHRLDPSAGVPIHFSRLAQLPMVALTWLFERCGFNKRGAGTLMAMIYPLMLMGGFFAALRWLAKNFMPHEWAGVTAFVVFFLPGTLFMFRPGHIDHHGLIVLMLTLALGCVLRQMERPDQMRWPIYAGLLMAVGQTVALEILPWLLLLSGWIGLWGIVRGKQAARQGIVYGLTFCLGSLGCLILTRPPADFMTLDVLTYSIVYVILSGGIAVTLAVIALISSVPIILRWIVSGIFAGTISFLFLRHFPELVAGPYGGIDPALAQIILDEIVEAQPYKNARNSWLDITRVMLPSCLAILASVKFLTSRPIRADDRWRWGLQLLLLGAAFSLSLFYQRRFVAVMGMLTVLPLSALLQRGWQEIGATIRGRSRVYAEIGLLLLVGPLPSVLYPALIDNRSFNTGVLLFAAGGAGQDKCQMYDLENILNDKTHLGDHPLLIMNTLSSGPEILFRTPHSVLSAPFHMDVAGNVDATRFFSTPYPAEAEAIARRRHIDLVVACRAFPEVYMRKNFSKELKEGESTADFAPHMIERLMVDKVPPWLKPVTAVQLRNYAVYEVDFKK